MELTLEMVREVFRNVLANKMTREAADRWAYSIINLPEACPVSFVPEAEKTRIWNAVMYLYGIDMMDSPGEYLHTQDDIRRAMKEKLGE